MAFYHHKNISLFLNNQRLFINSLDLETQVNLSYPINLNERFSEFNVPTAPVQGRLNIEYYLTGRDYIKNYLFNKENSPLSGNLNGINFSNGYISNYSLNAEPNQPIKINSTIEIFDELTGNFNSAVPQKINDDLLFLHFTDSYFNYFSDINTNLSGNQIINYNWNYRNTLTPVFYARQTEYNPIPDRVIIGEKEISASIISDTTDLLLPFSGKPIALELVCKHPILSGFYESFMVSGQINSKNFQSSTDNLSRTIFNITQSHINRKPTISGIDITCYPSNKYITIDSADLDNGFYTNNNLPIIEKIYLDKTELFFSGQRFDNYDRIYADINNETTNGSLRIETTKGLLLSPNKLILNFPDITVSGFYPETGTPGTLLTITGNNFNTIDSVLFNGSRSAFQVDKNNINNEIHSIYASVPPNTTIGKITVLSSLRNRSGVSTGLFYPKPIIDSISPSTGQWNDVINIEGQNFSGITQLLFNNILSPSFKVLTNNLITGQVPETGAGYTKGYISLTGYQNMNNIYSPGLYYPVVPIYSIYLNSGLSFDNVAIFTKIDTGFLSPSGGGFKVNFGGFKSIFYVSGNSTGTLTGIAPLGLWHNQKMALYEPDGVTLYPPYSGNLIQVGPAPIVESISPNTLNLYKPYNLSLNGKFFKDFTNLPWYFSVFKSGYTGYYSSIDSNSFFSNAIITGVQITGTTGYYDFNLRNLAGSHISGSGLLVVKTDNIANTNRQSINHSPAFGGIGETQLAPAGYSTDNNLQTYSATAGFSTNRGAYLNIIFDNLYDVFSMSVRQPILFQVLIGRRGGSRPFEIRLMPMHTGNIELYDLGGKLISGFTTGSLTEFNYIVPSNILTGIKQMKIFGSGDGRDRSLAFSEVIVYGTLNRSTDLGAGD